MNLKQLVDDTIKNIRGQAMQKTTQTLANVQRGIGNVAQFGQQNIVKPIQTGLQQQQLAKISYDRTPVGQLQTNVQRAVNFVPKQAVQMAGLYDFNQKRIFPMSNLLYPENLQNTGFDPKVIKQIQTQGYRSLTPEQRDKTNNIAMSAALDTGGFKVSLRDTNILKNSQKIKGAVDMVKAYDAKGSKPEVQMRYLDHLVNTAKEFIPQVYNSKKMKRLAMTDPKRWRELLSIYLNVTLIRAQNPQFAAGLSTSQIKRPKDVQAPGGGGLRQGQPEIGKQYESDNIVARDRFDIPKLKKLSSGGSDRDVYDLGNGQVLKVAKSARGLQQNISEGEPYAPVPKEIERGKNYVVVEKANPPDAKTKELIKVLQQNRDYNSRDQWNDMVNKTAAHYYDKGDEDMGNMLTDLLNYDGMPGDLVAKRNWGTINGEPVLLDAGTLSGRTIDDYKGKKNLDDPEFRDIYYQSKTAKKKFGDTDANTMYGASGALYGFEQDEDGNWRYNPQKGAYGMALGMGAIKGAKYLKNADVNVPKRGVQAPGVSGIEDVKNNIKRLQAQKDRLLKRAEYKNNVLTIKPEDRPKLDEINAKLNQLESDEIRLIRAERLKPPTQEQQVTIQKAITQKETELEQINNQLYGNRDMENYFPVGVGYGRQKEISKSFSDTTMKKVKKAVELQKEIDNLKTKVEPQTRKYEDWELKRGFDIYGHVIPKQPQPPVAQAPVSDIPLRDAARMPVDAKSVEIVPMDTDGGMKYFVKWIDKNGETQTTAKNFAWKEDAEKFVEKLTKSTPPAPVSGIDPKEIKRVADNLQKYNQGLGRLDAEAMAKNVIENRPYNQSPVSGMAQGTSQRPVGQLGKNLKVTDAYSDSFLGYNLKGMEKKAKEQGYDLYKALLDRVDSQGTVDAKIKGMESILDDLSGKPVSGAVKNQNALVKTGKPGALVKQQPQLPSTKPTQTGVLQPSVKPSQSVNPQTGLPGGGQIPPKLNKSGQNLGDNQTKDLSYKVTDRLYTEFVDRFHPISKLAKVAGKDKETARAIAGYYGSGSTANYHLQQELSPILKEQNITDLKEAAIAMRDVELSSRGIKGSPEQVKAQQKLQELTNKLGSQKMQELGATLQKLYAYQDAMVKKYLVDTGIMSQSSYQAMRKNNQFYVPMKRVMDQVDDFLGIPIKRGAGSMGKQNVIYGIKGSDKEIIDPIESIVENTYKLVSLGKRQEVAQTISGLRKEMPNVITRALKSDQQNTIGVFENGKKVFYNVPEEVADAARGMSEEQLVTLTKILKVPTDLFRTMTTGVNPEFLMPNVSRDTQSALFNAGVNPLKWVSGLAHFLKQDQVYKDFLKSGGKTSRISINRPYLKQTAEELAGKGFSIKSPKDIVRGLEMLSEVSEQPTRIAVFEDAYKRSLKQGISQEEALREAAYWAQEGTVNFARRGSKMTNINAIYAYLNARVQGVDRMLRTAKKEPGRAVVRWGFGMLAPAMALYAWNNSGERGNRYNDERILSKRDKEDNFIFMLPQTKNGVDYLKIPKSEIAKVVNPVETYLDFARGKGGNIAGSVASLVKSFSPIDNVGGLIPTAINPVVENAMNKDFYTGYDLVPEYKKSLPKGYQDSNYTSPVFRMIGQKTNQSPALLQNLAESYGGGMVRIAEMASQPLIDKKYVSAKNTQGAEINRTPVLRRFMGGEKKTETEQIKANISKQNAIKFQINDVKSAIRRGDIPADVGYQQIVKLMGEMPVTQPTTQPTPMKQVSIPTVKQTPIPMPTGKGIGGGKRKKISIKKPKQIKIKLKGFKKATQKKMKAVKIKKPKNIRIVTDKTKKA